MSNEERRRFFRIDDQVALSVTLIEKDSAYGDATNDLSQDDMMAVSLEIKIRHALAEVRGHSPKVATALDLLNQKINMLRTVEQTDDAEPMIRPVNLSACGISFTWKEKLPINQKVALTLYLQPRHEIVKALGHVAAVDRNIDPDTQQQEPYILRLDFDHLHSTYQEVLIQHVVQRQGDQLRKLKEQATE